MAYGRKTKSITKAVRILTDAEPQLVSLVDHGANQSGFVVVKSHKKETEEAAQLNQTIKEDSMTRTRQPVEGEKESTNKSKIITIKGKDSSAVDVQVTSISFKKSNFKTKDLVEKWLGDNGYVDFTVIEEGDSFVMKGLDETAFEGELRDIEAATGVTIKAGVLAAVAATVVKSEGTEAPSEAVADAGAAQEAAAEEKKDEAVVADAQAAEVAAPAEEVAKPADETDEAAAEKSAVAKTDKKEMTAKGAELHKEVSVKFDSWIAEMSNHKTIAGVFDDANDGLPAGIWELNTAFYTALRNATTAGDMAAVSAICQEFSDFFVKLAETFNKMDTATAMVQAQKSTESKEPNLSELIKAMTEQVSKTISEAIKPVALEVEGIKKSISEKEDRLSNLENAKQVRKGVDLDEALSSEQPIERTAKQVLDDPFSRGLMGISRKQVSAQPLATNSKLF